MVYLIFFPFPGIDAIPVVVKPTKHFFPKLSVSERWLLVKNVLKIIFYSWHQDYAPICPTLGHGLVLCLNPYCKCSFVNYVSQLKLPLIINLKLQCKLVFGGTMDELELLASTGFQFSLIFLFFFAGPAYNANPLINLNYSLVCRLKSLCPVFWIT